MNTNWQDEELLPLKLGDSNSWSVKAGKSERVITFEEAKEISSRWVPSSKVLIGAPGAIRLVPPICIKSLKSSAAWHAKKASRNAMVGATSLAVVLVGLGFSGENESPSLRIAIIGAWFAVAMSIEHFYGHGSLEEIERRSLFLYASRSKTPNRPSLWMWLAGALAFGSLQLSITLLAGSSFAPFEYYGFLYNLVADGEWWRVVTGPFLHFSFMHFGINATLLLIAAFFSSYLFGFLSFLYFVLICIFSGLVQWKLGPQLLGAYGGISGGVYGLFGLALGAYLGNPSVMPKSVAMLILNMSLIGIASTFLFSSTSADYAHSSGLLIGMLLAFGSARLKRIGL